jgi:hypothetical protein
MGWPGPSGLNKEQRACLLPTVVDVAREFEIPQERLRMNGRRKTVIGRNLRIRKRNETANGSVREMELIKWSAYKVQSQHDFVRPSGVRGALACRLRFSWHGSRGCGATRLRLATFCHRFAVQRKAIPSIQPVNHR